MKGRRYRNERDYQPNSGRARRSSAWPSMSSAPGRARARPGRASSSSAELGSAIRLFSSFFLLLFIFASDFQQYPSNGVSTQTVLVCSFSSVDVEVVTELEEMS